MKANAIPENLTTSSRPFGSQHRNGREVSAGISHRLLLPVIAPMPI
jgi:hypothetical protein